MWPFRTTEARATPENAAVLLCLIASVGCTDIITLLEGRPYGIMSMLNEEVRVPRGGDVPLLDKMEKVRHLFAVVAVAKNWVNLLVALQQLASGKHFSRVWLGV